MNAIEETIEALNPDLLPYVENGHLGPMIRHPLVFAIPLFPGTAAQLNEQLKYKKEYLAKAITEKDWVKTIALIEKPYRIHTTIELGPEMDEKSYWNCVLHSWTASENIFEVKDVLKVLFQLPRPLPIWNLMNKDEIIVLENLPDEIEIYRGSNQNDYLGWSWTLDRDKAKWFARRWNSEVKILVEGKVKKSKVIAYFDCRNESEIVTEPESVHIANSLKWC